MKRTKRPAATNDILPFSPTDSAHDEPRETPDPLLLHPTFDEVDDDTLLELDEEYWEALLPDDDYEPLPEQGDFWTDQDAA